MMNLFNLPLLMGGPQSAYAESASGMEQFMSFAPFILIIGIFYFLIIRPEKAMKKKKETLKAMPMCDLLRANDMEEYCELFEQNGIETIEMAITLSEMDLMDMGITVLGDKKKIISFLDKQRSILEAGNKSKCKFCGNLILNTVQICPHCRKRIKMATWLKIAIVLLVIVVLANFDAIEENIGVLIENTSNNTVKTIEDSSNPLAYTSWTTRGTSSWSGYDLSFNEDTYVMTNVYGIAYRGVYTVSGNSVLLIGGGVGADITGEFIGGRLIIGRSTWYKN
jgi:RNA polymerase subunit RPABC4/transcription elongation factor Spt4